MARGLTNDHPFDPKHDFWTGTSLFRRFNGQWRLVMHWSGRLAPVAEQLQEMVSAWLHLEWKTWVWLIYVNIWHPPY